MTKIVALVFLGALAVTGPALSAETEPEYVEHNMMMDHGDGHLMDMEGGMVMGQNKDKLPPGCTKISEDAEITVRAGHKYAKDFPGTMFGFDRHEWRVKPCARLTVHFINEDRIRHQWMMHGLPKFLYDKGMFHLEMTGPAKITGTLILPAEDRTYLVHCDIAQHMEKGMKGQLIVGKGSAPFPSIPGLTDLAIPDNYGAPVPPAPPKPTPVAASPTGSPSVAPSTAAAPPVTSAPPPKPSSGAFLLGILLGAFGTPFAVSRARKYCENTSPKEFMGCVQNVFKHLYDRALGAISRLTNSLRNR